MNVRISQNDFRFRITPQDLEMLLLGRDIDERICIGTDCFAYRISPVTRDRKMEMEMAVSGFCLFVPRETLEVLRDLGRSKEGVSVLQDGVTLSLQIDIKTQMKKAA